MERIDRRTLNLVPTWLLGSLSANEIKGACVLPSRPRPARRSTGRIHISDFRQHYLTLAKGSRSIHVGHRPVVKSRKAGGPLRVDTVAYPAAARGRSRRRSGHSTGTTLAAGRSGFRTLVGCALARLWLALRLQGLRRGDAFVEA